MDVTNSNSIENIFGTSLLAQRTEDAGEDLPDVKDVVKTVPHIPYILNGELYEIQTQDGENVTVRCCHCPPDRVYRGSVRSTGNFHMHIKRRHPDLLGKLHDMKVNALLERRDRLMRNRKVTTYRGSRSNKSREQQQSSSNTTLTSAHTIHKLKIKSAFQRHQFQQQQQQQKQQQQQQMQQTQQHMETIRHWGGITPFVVVPIGEASAPDVCEPINYSIKSDNLTPLNLEVDEIATIDDEQRGNDFITLQIPPTQSENHTPLIITTVQQQPLPPPTQQIYTLNENSTSNDRVSDLTPCPSTFSSYGSNISVGNSQYNSISVIKNELLMPEKAIDLTMNTSLLSSSSGIGSANTTLSTETLCDSNDNAAGSISPKHNNVLQQVEVMLREIRREMRARNQIETNRIFLDIAKFKYLHPGFNFQC